MSVTRSNRFLIMLMCVAWLTGCGNSQLKMLAPLDGGDVSAAGNSEEDDSGPLNAFKRAANAVSGPDTSLPVQQKLGDKFARKTLSQVKRSANKPLERKLNEIVTRLAEHIDGNPFTYQVYLVDDKRANAYTPGGGHLFITTGLVRVLKSEAQMAMVLAHEMAHNMRADVVKGERGRAMARGATMFSKRLIDKQLGLPWLAESVDFVVKTSLNAYTRDQESEADKLGLKYMVAAGYDPHEGQRTFENLMLAHKEKPELMNFFFGDHPTNKMRVWQITNLIKSKYSNLQIDWRIRSTPGYDLLASRYWRQPVSPVAPTASLPATNGSMIR